MAMDDRMRRILITAFVLAASSTAAWSQAEPDTDAFDGNWAVTMASANGSKQTAQVRIKDFAGTWRSSKTSDKTAAVDKACNGKAFPITVQVSQASTLEFTVWGSSIAPTCPDLSIALKPNGPKVLEGKVNQQQDIRLTRR